MSAAPAHALDAPSYTDRARFEREQKRVFRRAWQYAGHRSRLGAPGDYFAFALHGRSLFCLKGHDGIVRTFYNACAHRAHQLVEGSGNKRSLVCPYHAWCYELDGRLRRAPGSDEVPGFDRAAVRLNAVRTEVIGGFIFVNLDPDAAPMSCWYPGLEAQLEAFIPDLARLRPVYTRKVVEQCNWKVSVENYSECYHCRLNHPTFANGVVDAANYDIRPLGRMLRHATRCVAVEAMSYPIDADSHPHAMDYRSWFLWPTFSFQVYPGNVLNTYEWQLVDHRTTRVVRQWFSVDGAESDTLHRLAEQDLDTTVAEDIRLVESVQRGLESGGYRPGPLVINPAGGVNSEHSIRSLNTWLVEAMRTENRMQWSTQPELIEQIIDGVKTATVTRLEWQDGYDEYSTPLRVGEIYTVYDGERIARCRVRVTALERTRWGEIPERLWRRDPATTGETSLEAFMGDHYEFFGRPDAGFEFVAVYFDRLEDAVE